MAHVDRDLRDSVTFWLGLGGGVAVIGGILVGVGVAQVAKVQDATLWVNAWFDVGITSVALGAAALFWSLVLFVAHGHVEGHRQTTAPRSPASPSARAPLPTQRPPQPTPPRQADPDRLHVPAEVTPESVKAMFDDVTEVQGHRLADPYIGRWMTLSGTVKNVDSPVTTGEIRLLLEEHPAAFAYFDADEAEGVSLYSRGHRVSLIGQIERVGTYGVSLDHCKITSD